MTRLERLMAITELLRARRTGMTAGQLAERFGVTERTIYRDLDALRAASFPVVGERGRGGGFALARDYALPPVGFTAREAALLVVAGEWLTNLRLMPFTQTLASAIDKVRAALPAARQFELNRLRQGVKYTGVPSHDAKRGVREVVEQAWFEDRPMLIAYDGAGGLSRRRVRLEQVIMERTETLLSCFDLDKGAKRQFKLHKIQSAVLCETEELSPSL